MSFCGNCGTRLDDHAWRCPNCGMPVPGAEEPEPVYTEPSYPKPSYSEPSYSEPSYPEPNYPEPSYSERSYPEPTSGPYDRPAQPRPPVYGAPPVGSRRDFNAVKDTVVDSAGKAISGAKNIAGQIGKKVEERNAAITAKVEEDARKQKEAQQHAKTMRMSEGTRHMSTTELWSWLKQSSKRQMFYTEQPSDLSEDAFMGKIQRRLEENAVPASVEQRTIEWDRSGVNKSVYLVKPETEVVNPLSCLVQFNHVGNFTFVEEKTFITPPDLPEVPEKPLPLDSSSVKWASMLLLYGIIAAIAGLVLFSVETGIAFFVLLLGAGMLAGSYFMNQKNRAIREHNAKCAAQERAWNAAWENWKNSIFLHSFQEDINGQLSRIFDSVFETIKQVNSELFSASKSVEQEESSKMNELEQLIARRKEEYR